MQKNYAYLIFILLTPSAFAACNAKADDSASYSKAEAIVYTLPEVKEWKKLVYAVPGRKVITLPSIGSQSLINGKCYWPVNLYENMPDHVTRWNMFYVKVNGKHILVDDITGGDPMTLQQWRAQLKRLHSNKSTHRDTMSTHPVPYVKR